MTPAPLSLDSWVHLPPTLRDAVRIGHMGYSLPSGVGRWPETQFGWEILLGRFADDRRRETIWTGVEPPISIAERTARGAYEAWLNPVDERVYKKSLCSEKKSLTPETNPFKKVFKAIAWCLQRSLSNTGRVVKVAARVCPRPRAV